MRIATIVNNSMRYDERVKRQIEFFSSLDYEVMAFGVITEKDLDIPDLPQFPNVQYFLIDRRKKKIVNWLLAMIPNKISLLLLKLGFNRDLLNKFAITTTYIPLFLKLHNIKADFYYANDLDTASIGQDVSKKNGGKFIYDAHEYYYGQTSEMPHYLKKAIEQHERQAFLAASERITVSESIAAKLAEKYDHYIPIVVRNVGKYIDVPEVSKVSDPIRLLYQSANIDLNGRNLKILIDAVSQIGNVYLTIRGNIEEIRKHILMNYLIEKLPENNYILEPAVPYSKLIEEASQHDIGFILNSPDNENHRLTLPNKIFEYMNAGLAVISFDTIELRSIINHYEIGEICEEINPEALANSISKLLSNRTRLLQMKEKAFQLSRTEFNWEKESKKLGQIFNRNL